MDRSLIRKKGIIIQDRLFLLVLVLIISLYGCAPKIIPSLNQPGSIDKESNIITRTKDNITISVQTEEWHYPPYSLVDYFTPFLFLIRNDTDHKISLKYKDFILFDERGNQFEAIDPEKVEYIMASIELYGAQYPDILFRVEESKPPYTYGVEVPAYLRKPFSNISLLALPEVTIYPHSQVRGFVYFRKAVTYGKTLRLKVEINGIEEDFIFEIKR